MHRNPSNCWHAKESEPSSFFWIAWTNKGLKWHMLYNIEEERGITCIIILPGPRGIKNNKKIENIKRKIKETGSGCQMHRNPSNSWHAKESEPSSFFWIAWTNKGLKWHRLYNIEEDLRSRSWKVEWNASQSFQVPRGIKTQKKV